jgi:hypothetical protein
MRVLHQLDMGVTQPTCSNDSLALWIPPRYPGTGDLQCLDHEESLGYLLAQYVICTAEEPLGSVSVPKKRILSHLGLLA